MTLYLEKVESNFGARQKYYETVGKLHLRISIDGNFSDGKIKGFVVINQCFMFNIEIQILLLIFDDELLNYLLYFLFNIHVSFFTGKNNVL